MLGPNSQYGCLDKSHEVESDGVLPEGENAFEYPDDVEKDYSKEDLEMEEGGV